MRYVALGSTFDVKFTTRRFSSGVPFTLVGGVLGVFIGNNTSPITAGITLTADFSGRAGLNNARIVATGANGYTLGDCDLVLTAGTIDGVSVVGEVVDTFVIGAQVVTLTNTQGVRKNTALAGFEFVMAASGLTVTLQRSIDGAAFNPATNAPTNIGTTKAYKIDLSAADLNGDTILFWASAAGQPDSFFTIRTMQP